MMTNNRVEQQYRSFLLATAGLIFTVTPVELLLTEHHQSAVQGSAFLFCGAGLAAVLAVRLAPRRRMLLGFRGVMAALILGSIFGLYEHFEHNLAFEREIRPAATFQEIAWEALFGASPLLAPGILALGALLALAATYHHPALTSA